jgi:transposase
VLLCKLLWQTRSRSQRRDHRVNGIESFWSFAKRRLGKFNGIPKQTFYLYLKETEFRFNDRLQDTYKTLLSCFRNHPL